MRRIAILIETARPKALGERVIHHDIRCDVPRQGGGGLEAGLGVFETLGVQVVRVKRIVASTCRESGLEAAETGNHAAGFVVVELEIARARCERQRLRNKVVIEGSKESQLPCLALVILVERAVVRLNARVLDCGAGKRANVREATGRDSRATRWNGLVQPRA